MAVRFDASGEYLARGTNLPAYNLFTIAGWVQIVTDRNALTEIFDLINSDGSGGVRLMTTADGTTLRIYTGSYTTGTSLTVGQWYHVALTRNGSTCRAYIDGVLDITHTNSDSFTPAYLLLGFPSNWLNGRLGQVRVWDAELSASEIRAEMRSTSPVRTSNLNSAHPFTSSITADVSGNGRNLSVGGGTPALETPEPPVYAVMVTGTASASGLALTAIGESGGSGADAAITTGTANGEGQSVAAQTGSGAAMVGGEGSSTGASVAAASGGAAGMPAGSGAAGGQNLTAAASVAVSFTPATGTGMGEAVNAGTGAQASLAHGTGQAAGQSVTAVGGVAASASMTAASGTAEGENSTGAAGAAATFVRGQATGTGGMIDAAAGGAGSAALTAGSADALGMPATVASGAGATLVCAQGTAEGQAVTTTGGVGAVALLNSGYAVGDGPAAFIGIAGGGINLSEGTANAIGWPVIIMAIIAVSTPPERTLFAKQRDRVVTAMGRHRSLRGPVRDHTKED